MIVNANELVIKAMKGQYAIPHLNVNNLEWARLILEVCQEQNSPVILGVSEGAAKYMGGYNTVASIIRGLDKDLNITVPVVIHLDHGSSFESCKAAIDAGFTSVMIDASNYDLENNILITKEVVSYAKQFDVSVEAELGHVGGNEDGLENEILYADLDDCVKLVEATDITMLAPALGSVHGPYQGEPKLGFDEMEAISKATKIGLVLHGGTGIPAEQIKKAIARGTIKINVNTDLQIAFTKAVREYLNSDSENYDPRKYLKAGMVSAKAVCEDKIELFGSANKA